MSTLTLVRHGQARPFDQKSGLLSDLGERQSCGLAEWWIRAGIQFDEVYTGTLVRQQRTAAVIGEKFIERGLPWSSPIVLPGLDEYDVSGIIRLAQRNAELGALIRDAEATGPDRHRRFQRMFEAVMTRWVSGELADPAVESWIDFRERVRGALRIMTAGNRPGRRVVAFTSGGPIGVAVQTALGAPDPSAIEVNWRVRNCSLTEFLFSRERFSLDCFNAVPHLDAALLSFR